MSTRGTTRDNGLKGMVEAQKGNKGAMGKTAYYVYKLIDYHYLDISQHANKLHQCTTMHREKLT